MDVVSELIKSLVPVLLGKEKRSRSFQPAVQGSSGVEQSPLENVHASISRTILSLLHSTPPLHSSLFLHSFLILVLNARSCVGEPLKAWCDPVFNSFLLQPVVV